MVKVESGLFSELKGTLQKSRTTFQTRKSGIVAEKKPIPPKEPKGRRECIRWIYRYLCDKWNTLSEQEKQQYDETAEKHNITLFNAFLKEELTPRLWKCKLSKIDGQVLYLPLVEGEGNVAKDFSGYGNNGTIYGATWEKTDNNVNVLSFDGVDDKVLVSYNGRFGGWDGITVITVAKDDRDFYGTISYEQYALKVANVIEADIRVKSDTEQKYYHFNYFVNGTRRYSWTDPTGREKGKWYFIAFRLDFREGEGRVFQNDQKFRLYNAPAPNTSWDYADNPVVEIGTGDVINEYFKGGISLIAVFNRALTDNEILSLYSIAKKHFPL